MTVMYDLSFVATMSAPVADEDVVASFEEVDQDGFMNLLDVVFSADGRTVSGIGNDGDAEEAFETLVGVLLELGAERVTSVLVSDDGAVGTVALPDARYWGELDVGGAIVWAEDPAQALDDLWVRGGIGLNKA